MLVAERGTLEILTELLKTKNSLRFKEILKKCKIPQNTIVRRLKDLETHNLIERRVHKDRTVTYTITEKGKQFHKHLFKLNDIIKEKS